MNASKLVFVVVGVILILALPVSGFVLEQLAYQGRFDDKSDTILFAIYLVVASYITLLCWYLSYAAIRALVVAGSQRASIFGSSPGIRLLSLGITVLLFQTVVIQVVYLILDVVRILAFDIPNALFDGNVRYQVSNCLPSEMADCAITLHSNLFTDLNRLLQGVLSQIGNVNLLFLIVAAVVWMLAGQAMSIWANPSEPHTPIRSLVMTCIERLRKLPSAYWVNLFLIAFLLTGGMLSISAIVAIPIISETSELSASERQRQEERIAQLTQEAEILREASAAPNFNLQQLLGPLDNWLDDPAHANSPDKNLVERFRQVSESRVTELERTWNTHLSITNILDRMRLSAIGALNRSANWRLSPAVQSNYQQELLSSVQYANENIRYEIRRCRDEINNSLSYLRFMIGQVINSANTPSNFDMSGNPTESSFILGAASDSGSLPQSCYHSETFREPEDPRGTYGISFVVDWLIGFNSLALVSIAGMLGFGILGSTISTFVREKSEKAGISRDRGTPTPIVQDLYGVILRGFSATLVVYLSVKGGLSIFSLGSNTEPNPYVLLLSCLIAAVYSEEVWIAARNNLKSKLKGDQEPEPPSMHDDDAVIPDDAASPDK